MIFQEETQVFSSVCHLFTSPTLRTPLRSLVFLNSSLVRL